MKEERKQILITGLKKLYRIAYWVMPPLLLFLILGKIDGHLLRQHLAGTNLGLLLLGLCYCPLIVVIAGIRWKIALSEYFHIHFSPAHLVRHYWIGMALGFFSPGQLGLDVYRVVLVGRRCGHYVKVVLSILLEKAMALLTALVLVLCLYPIIRVLITRHQPVVSRIVEGAYIVGLIALVSGGLIFVLTWHKLSRRMVKRLYAIVKNRTRRATGMVDPGAAAEDEADLSRAFSSLPGIRPFVLVFAASLAIQIASATGNHVIFQAVGHDVPFLVNLFLTPLFYFVFLLPVSFGSLGIREGLYILLYGAFGVPPEVALLVSFINLTGLLVNNAIGALMIWVNRRKGPDSRNICEEPAGGRRVKAV